MVNFDKFVQFLKQLKALFSYFSPLEDKKRYFIFLRKQKFMREYEEVYHSEPISIESLASWVGGKCPKEKFEDQIYFSNFNNRDMNDFDDKVLDYLKTGLINKSTLRDFVNSGILEIEAVQKKWSIRHAMDDSIRAFVMLIPLFTGLFIGYLVINSDIERKDLAAYFSVVVVAIFIYLLWGKIDHICKKYIRKNDYDNIYYKFRWTDRGNLLFQKLELEKPSIQFDPSCVNT